MKRKLSTIENIIEGNVCFYARVEGTFAEDRLRLALKRLQRKHPALRALIREEPDGLYYEYDVAPPIPLRIVARVNDDDYRREYPTELAEPFSHDQPQLRVLWLPAKQDSDLLFTASHRICDGMSMLTIVRDVVRWLYADHEDPPHDPVTPLDIIADYKPKQLRRRKLLAGLFNTFVRLIPASRKKPDNREHHLEWASDQAFSNALKQRCKVEGVSVHAALLVALNRALLATLGNDRMPSWIICPMDARRDRLSALQSDNLFFGGGNLKFRAHESSNEDFWSAARAIHAEIGRQIEAEANDIPSRYHFCEMLKPPSRAQIQSLARLGDLLGINGSLNRFALSNLGNVVLLEKGAPFKVTDLRVFVHSFNVRVLGVIAYALNGQMRFIQMHDEKCLTWKDAERLKHEFMRLLERHLTQPAAVENLARVPDTLSA